MVDTAGLPLLNESLLDLGALQQLLSRLRVPVQNRVLAHIPQLLLNVVENGELAGVDDGHVHASRDSVVEEDRVHGLADLLESTEGEREVGKAARDLAAGARGLDPLGCVDEVDTIVVVLLETGADGEDVEVKDDVNGVEADLGTGEDLVGALADADLVLLAGGLALLIEGHDDDGRSIALNELGVLDEFLLTNLERDGVDNALALQALEAGNADFELGRVDDDGDLGNLGLSGNEVAELAHAVNTVKHTIVKVDVENLGAVLDLLFR